MINLLFFAGSATNAKYKEVQQKMGTEDDSTCISVIDDAWAWNVGHAWLARFPNREGFAGVRGGTVGQDGG